MTPGSLRERILAGDPVFGTFLFGTSALLAEVAARSGPDWLLIDLEHGGAGAADLLALLMAVEVAGVPPLVRVEAGERIRVGRALDLGARGVMVPQVHSAAQAREVASWMRTQPAGQRGIALFTRGMDFGAGGDEAAIRRHEELLCIVQIESRSALDEVEAIAAVDGVDVLFVGPADLSHALGVPGRTDDAIYLAAVERVGNACRAAGKAAGIMLRDPADAGRYRSLGYQMFALSTDASIFDRALRATLQTARAAAGSPTTEVP